MRTIANETGSAHPRAWLVLPAPRHEIRGRPSGLATIVVESLVALATRTLRLPVAPVTYDARGDRLRRFADGPRPWPAMLRGTHFFLGANVLLRGGEGLEALLSRGMASQCACAGTPEGSLRAFSWIARGWKRPVALQALLARLTHVAGDALPALELPESAWCAPPYGGPFGWAARFGDAKVPHRYDDPEYVNTALAEILGDERGNPSRDWRAVADDLLRLRDASRVPWIFNELLCDVEHRAAVAEPRSHPPEVHLSLSAACNTECAFCSYSHRDARRHHVTAEDLLAQPFLRHVRTLRLHSGNGEPTLNPHLGGIVRALGERHPHLGLNFSTNGILLGREGLAEDLVGGNVKWVNVSINASSAERWSEYAAGDHFERIRAGMRRLAAVKRAARAAEPVAFASIVLTRHSIRDLPSLPAIAAELGALRLTGIPFSSIGYASLELRYGPEDAYHVAGEEYARAYAETLEEARRCGISLELPVPEHGATQFGVEARPVHDFAGLDENLWRVALLVAALEVPAAARAPCPSLWRLGAITHSRRAAGTPHYLYPCLGPMGAIDLSARLGIHLPDTGAFDRAWSHPLMTRLRQAQRVDGMNPVCDRCRRCDSRDPEQVAPLEKLLEDYRRAEGIGGEAASIAIVAGPGPARAREPRPSSEAGAQDFGAKAPSKAPASNPFDGLPRA